MSVDPGRGATSAPTFIERGAAVGLSAKVAAYTLLPIAVAVIVVAMATLPQGPGRRITPAGLLAAVIATALLVVWLRTTIRVLGQGRIGVRVDSSGLTVGDVGPTRSRPTPPEAVSMHPYSAPWSEVYDARLVIDPAQVASARQRSAVRQMPGSRIKAPSRPAYFPDSGPLFMCKVDPAQVRWPALPVGVAPSHVWTVPVRDLDGLTAALERHGIPVRRSAPALGPTRETDMVETDLRSDPGYQRVADHLRGALPRSRAELEAAMVRDLKVEPYLT